MEKFIILLKNKKDITYDFFHGYYYEVIDDLSFEDII
jgi:hypothetical protein